MYVRFSDDILQINGGMKMPTDNENDKRFSRSSLFRDYCSHLVFHHTSLQRHIDHYPYHTNISSITIYHHTIGKINNATNNRKKRKKEEDWHSNSRAKVSFRFSFLLSCLCNRHPQILTSPPYIHNHIDIVLVQRVCHRVSRLENFHHHRWMRLRRFVNTIKRNVQERTNLLLQDMSIKWHRKLITWLMH